MRRIVAYGPSLLVLGTTLLVLLLGPSVVRNLSFVQARTRMILASERLESDTNVLGDMSRAYRDIAARVEPSVVHISALQAAPSGRRSTSSGSGWIYDADGHIVTNHHVVAGAERLQVQLASGELRPAELVGSDPSTDIAVIRIDPGNLLPSTLGDVREPVQQGDLVFAFGSPFDFRFSMSSGIVSGKGRSVGVIGAGAGFEDFIQTDAAINVGNSGGPLTDWRGRVVGMNTAIVTGTPGQPEGQFAGVGLAIPLEMIVPAVEQLIENGFVAKGYLGVRIRSIWPQDRVRLGWNGDGAHVYEVMRGGPADMAGLRVDDVVVAVNGRRIETHEQLRSAISSLGPGERAVLEVRRWDADAETNEAVQVTVQLDRRRDFAG